ncbi:MAG TPA: thioesterase family protein [Candidatus Binataceae bacterium]|jgi:acyl-CoA thioester hydrolase
MTFPYSLFELDLSAPLDRYRAVVLPEWIDSYGHMNMAVYVTVFDQAADVLCALLGVGPLYTEHRIGMLFVLETHLAYAREVRLGAPLRVTSQILDHDAKRLHLFHRMYHGEEGWPVATNEVLMINVDYKTRRTRPWPDETMRRLRLMATAHAALLRPEDAGRVIRIKKSA